jgi:hypothetical protein
MSKQVSQTRAVLMGLLFALVGFSYAIATSSSRAVSDDAGSRIVGSAPLRFTNPLVGGVRDLGIAATGSAVTRYARATGGVRPYKFTSSGTPSLASAIATSNAQLELLLNGCLSGSLGNLPAGALTFNITVTDSKGTQPNSVTELFRLTLDNSGVFKFAQSQLSEGVQFQPYFDKLEVINGNTPITFSASTITLNGVAQTSMEAVGLSLSSTDGQVFGKPIVSGTLSFLARAVDARGNAALNTAGTAANQTVTITLTSGITVGSDVVITKATVKLSAAGKESIDISGMINLAGRRVSDFSGESIEVRIGGYDSSDVATIAAARFDAKGKLSSAKGTKTDVIKASISSKGQLKIKISKATIAARLGTVSGATANLAVGIKVGDMIASAAFLQFSIKGTAPKQSLSYSIGKNSDPGGEFILTKVQGKDTKGGTTTAFKIDFLALAPGNTNYGNPTSASVAIGDNFTDSVTVETNGTKVKNTDKPAKTAAEVLKLTADGAKGKGSVTTGPLSPASTNIMQAGTSTATGRFLAMGLTFIRAGVATYQGEGSIGIVGTGKGQYTSAPK